MQLWSQFDSNQPIRRKEWLMHAKLAYHLHIVIARQTDAVRDKTIPS
jgi:hypothetical protein